MTSVTWPNPVSPGLRPFRLDVPPDWTAVEPPGGLIAFLGPEVEGFRPNVVVFGKRMPKEATLEEFAENGLREGGATIEDGGRDRDDAGDQLPIAVRTGTMQVDDRVVRQVAVATEASDWSPAGLRSIYALVGTYLADRRYFDDPVVTAMISSFTLQEVPGQ